MWSNVSFGRWVLVIFLFIVFFFLWVTLLWATWNYTIPQIQNSLAGATVPFNDLSWPTSIVFGFLILFLSVPFMGCHKIVTNNFLVVEGPEVVEVEEVREEPVYRTTYTNRM
jgi:TRAP-type C4-dicarboxylate transport system permease small subunit